MKSEHQVKYGGELICFDVVRRERRTLQISVAPDMKVRVVAPRTASHAAILKRVHKRAGWIRKQLRFFKQFEPRTPERLYVAGETHLYLGRRYRLKLIANARSDVRLRAGFIEVHGDYPFGHGKVRHQLERWYKHRARAIFGRRLELCLAQFPDPARFRPRALVIRKLKRRWGSMSSEGRLVLNWSLLRASVHEVDYVISHELCHLAFPDHGKQFYRLLRQVMPDWGRRKASLEGRLA